MAQVLAYVFQLKRYAVSFVLIPALSRSGSFLHAATPIGVFDRVNLQNALAKLPEGYKSMFLLHDVQGFEHNEIAAMLGCSVGNSKSQLHKARKRLREILHEVRHYASHRLAEIASSGVSQS